MKNYINGYTRIARSYYEKKNKFITSKTIIDVATHNGESLIETKVIGCPFSDHHFVIAALDFNPAKKHSLVKLGASTFLKESAKNKQRTR